jgi:HSP20 family protein
MASITRLEPFEDFFKGFWMSPVKIDVSEDEKSFTVKADIPGVKKEDIQIDIDDDRVSIRAEAKKEKEEKKDEKVVYSERAYGMVSRSFTLPADVDANGAKAEYRDGVLNLLLPKKANGTAKRLAVS